MSEAQIAPHAEIQRTAEALTQLLLQLQEARSGKHKVETAPALFKASERDAALLAISNVRRMAATAAILVASLPDLLNALQEELVVIEDGPANTPTGLSYDSPIPKGALSTRALTCLASGNRTTLRGLCALVTRDLLLLRGLGKVTYDEIVSYRAQLGVPMQS